jgi:Flp pilus assembly protein TadG
MFNWAYLIPLAPFIMVLGIVFIKSRANLEEKRLTATASESAEKAAQYATQVAKLEDRVQVLERIVTDRGYDIATQIEALRDTRKVETRDAGIPLNISKQEQV